MKRLVIAVFVLGALCGCANTGISGEESRAQSKEWDGDAYEKAMRDAGKGDEYDAEVARGGLDQGQGQDQDQELGQVEPGN